MRVLIAEDDRVSRDLLQQVLGKWGCEVVVTSDGDEAWEVLQHDDAPRLAILDWMMPGLDGPEICRRVRARNAADPPYVILLTARGGKDDIVIGLEAGADDYVGKPFDRAELLARLEVGRRFTELNARLLETQRILAEQALTDALTGVMNRRAILGRLEEEIARAHREETTLGVGMIDIDHFKRVNDVYGHTAGDAVLREIAVRSRSAMRQYDAFGRFGGEEFLAIVPDSPDSEVRGVLERIRTAVCAGPVETQGNTLMVTVSIGGVTSGASSADMLICSVDDALYKAKADGRNRVVMATLVVG